MEESDMGRATPLAVLAIGLLSLSGTARAGASPWEESARYGLEYRVDVAALAQPPAARLRVWIPYPVENADQRIESAQIESPWPYHLYSDDIGNRMLFVESTTAAAAPLTMHFVVERRPSKGIVAAAVTAGSRHDPHRFLQPNRLIPLDGLIRQIAAEQSRGLESDGQKVRAFYSYVIKNLRYNKEGSGWGRGDVVWACANQRGNCTDFHSLFIGMARSQHIPARFVIGLPIPEGSAGDIPGYHCWSEYWEAARGWVPLDASEAQKRGQPDAYFGALPNDRIQFTTGRDLMLVPPQQGPPLNFFIYPYAEADDRPVYHVPATFRFERLPVRPAQR
jgi:transglutaminase-like putative cysteine protease